MGIFFAIMFIVSFAAFGFGVLIHIRQLQIKTDALQDRVSELENKAKDDV